MDVQRPHVMVETPRDLPNWPGLLMMWRQGAGGEWEGWVAVMMKSNAHGGFDRCEMRWVPASQMRPA
jgi:hypothetical protein